MKLSRFSHVISIGLTVLLFWSTALHTVYSHVREDPCKYDWEDYTDAKADLRTAEKDRDALELQVDVLALAAGSAAAIKCSKNAKARGATDREAFESALVCSTAAIIGCYALHTPSLLRADEKVEEAKTAKEAAWSDWVSCRNRNKHSCRSWCPNTNHAMICYCNQTYSNPAASCPCSDPH